MWVLRESYHIFAIPSILLVYSIINNGIFIKLPSMDKLFIEYLMRQFGVLSSLYFFKLVLFSEMFDLTSIGIISFLS